MTVLPAAYAGPGHLTTDSVEILEPHLRVSTERLTLTEGGAGAYTVALGTQPATTTIVTATSSNPQIAVDGDSTPLARTLTFTTENWNTAQTVTVRALADDADAVDEWVDIAHSGFGGAPEHVLVTVDDDEETGTDYDADNDLLIEVDSLARLNALRWDLNGDGTPATSATSSYAAAFGGAAAGMGCPDGPDADQLPDSCTGYELATDLDFDTDSDGDVDSNDDYPNWTPIGGTYAATFDGNNRVISNLTIVDAAGSAGLFNTVSGTVRGLGLADADVSGVGDSTTRIAPLAAEINGGSVIASWASGRVYASTSNTPNGGGLVGRVDGSSSRLAASYSVASVAGFYYSGGLAGVLTNGGTITACYATGSVAANGGKAGGLIGNNTGSTVTASYFAGTVSASGGGDAGGVSGEDDGADETYNHVYFDVDSTGISYGAGQTTTVALQTPTAATGTLYANWDNLDVDGDGTADEAPWDFGSAWNYPALNYGGLDPADQRNDYDADGDGLIEIDSLAKLNAMRWDVDGDGAPAPGATSTTAYYGVGAFFNAVSTADGTGLVCPTTPDDADDNDCAGYELVADIDFDTNGDGERGLERRDLQLDAHPGLGDDARWRRPCDREPDRERRRQRPRAVFDGDDGRDGPLAGPGGRLGDGHRRAAGPAGGGVRRAHRCGVRDRRGDGERGGLGGLVAEVQSSSARIVASYSTVDVECTSNQNWARVGGLAARNDGIDLGELRGGRD